MLHIFSFDFTSVYIIFVFICYFWNEKIYVVQITHINNNNKKLFHLEQRQWSFFCLFVVHYVEKKFCFVSVGFWNKIFTYGSKSLFIEDDQIPIIILRFNCLALHKYHLLLEINHVKLFGSFEVQGFMFVFYCWKKI